MYSFCSSLDDTAHVPLVQLGGTTVFSQTPMLTTAETVKQPFTMQMVLNWKGQSRGRLSLDDGLTIGNIAAGDYNSFSVTAHFSRSAASSNFTGVIRYQTLHLAPSYDVSGLFIQRVVLLGADLKDDAAVAMPMLTMAGKEVPLHGMTLRVVNGAVVMDSTASSLPVGQSWQLRWLEPHTETKRYQAVAPRQANRSTAASE